MASDTDERGPTISPVHPWRYRAWDFVFNHSPLPSFLPFAVHLRWSRWALRHLDKHWQPDLSGR